MTLRNTSSHQYSRVESVFAQEVGDIWLAMQAQERGIQLRRECKTLQAGKGPHAHVTLSVILLKDRVEMLRQLSV